jgi:sec-independent protein translocase protein TatA
MAMFGLGAQELMLILLIALVLFGGSKIPDLGRSLGQAIREFKKGVESSDSPSEPREGGDRTKDPGRSG